MGYLRVTVGNPRVTIGHLRVTMGTSDVGTEARFARSNLYLP